MRFEEAYGGWQGGRLTQEEAARLPGICGRSFRLYIDRYEEGLDGLNDKRLNQVLHRRVPVNEAIQLVDRYRRQHESWNVKHFYAGYKRDGGGRSYTWVKKPAARRALRWPRRPRANAGSAVRCRVCCCIGMVPLP